MSGISAFIKEARQRLEEIRSAQATLAVGTGEVLDCFSLPPCEDSVRIQ